MISEIYQNLLYFLKLTINTEVSWIVLPLTMATIAMIVYFEKYKDERPGWNTHFANSLILLFVSIILLRYIYNLNDSGAINFITHSEKSIISIMVLIIGIIILLFNFEHFLPEKIAKNISSPLTLNLIAYIIILYVYSEISGGWSIFFSLLILFILLIVLLNLIKFFLKNLFEHLKKMKEREKVQEIEAEKKPIEEKKKEIKKVEKKVKREKKELIEKEKAVVQDMLKKLDAQKKEAIKLKKIAKKKK